MYLNLLIGKVTVIHKTSDKLGAGVPLLFFKFGGSCVCGPARQNGQRFLRAPRAVVCDEAAGSVRCLSGARADAVRTR